jgi:hypothetical protein
MPTAPDERWEKAQNLSTARRLPIHVSGTGRDKGSYKQDAPLRDIGLRATMKLDVSVIGRLLRSIQ